MLQSSTPELPSAALGAERASRWALWSWGMVVLAPVGLLLAVGVSRLVVVGDVTSVVDRVALDAVGLVAMAAPQMLGAALAVTALRRIPSRLAWMALTANLILLGLPFFLAAGGGNVINVTSLAAISALAVRFSRAA
jgi:hypothetical protein